ncbi:MAG TPA: hypothetical protein VN922_17170 [Bacteroidia bacterium]|nr:hypothetical protein [Bacteroidia bacterium]
MELLLYTDILFIVAGLAQIFWALPMIKAWGLRWYYLGIFGTAALSPSLLFTRLPNGVTGTALIDTNPMAMLTEISQFLYIGATTIIARRTYLRQTGRFFLAITFEDVTTSPFLSAQFFAYTYATKTDAQRQISKCFAL